MAIQTAAGDVQVHILPTGTIGAVTFGEASIEPLRQALNRALNTWPEAPQELFQLASILDNAARVKS